DVRRSRPAAVRGAGSPRAAGLGRTSSPPRPWRLGSAVAAEAPDRPTGGGGALEPGDRRAALPLSPNRRVAPVSALPETRRYVPCAATGRARGHSALLTKCSKSTYATGESPGLESL